MKIVINQRNCTVSMAPKESEGMSVSREEVLVEDNEDVQVSNNSETELKSKKTSKDVTKALMLLGFNSWSAFEQGILSIFFFRISYICNIIMSNLDM